MRSTERGIERRRMQSQTQMHKCPKRGGEMRVGVFMGGDEVVVLL
jgi:hypothetical protein